MRRIDARWRAAASLAAFAGLTIMALREEGSWLPGMDQGFTRHATLAALTAGACASALGADRFVRDTAVAAASAGANRMRLGVRWLTDVLAGWLFAAGWHGLTRALLPRVARTKP